MKETPFGITEIGLLQIAGCMASILFSLIFWAASFADGSQPSSLTDLSFLTLLYISSPIILGSLGLLLAILMMNGFKPAWYASLIYWTILTALLSFMLVQDSWSGLTNLYLLFFPLPPMLFSIVSIVYFQTEEVKKYFGVQSAATN